jgi:hypothetical protein
VEVTKVAGADNGDELAAFDPESWLKVRSAVIRVHFAIRRFILLSIKSHTDFSLFIPLFSIDSSDCNRYIIISKRE